MNSALRVKALHAVMALVLALGSFASLGRSTPAFASGATVVTPASADWKFVNDNGTTGDWTAGFQNGPATPPLGVGSVQISLNSAAAGIVFGTAKYQGTKLADIQALSYSTYTNLAPAAMSFQINYDPDLTAAGPKPWYGRLVYEPYMNGTVTNGTWQTWDPIDGGAGLWWASSNANSPVDNTCGQATPCTWSTIIANWPNIGIRNDASSFIQFKAGSAWNGFVGNVDNFSIETSNVTDTYDFELPSTVYVNASWAGTTAGTDPDGSGPATSFGADAFDTIQGGVNGVATGGTVLVAAGTYAENVTITTPLTLVGAGQATTTILPAVSDPNCGGAGGGSLCGTGGSYVILVQANNVTIHDLAIDGDNPALTSGIVVGGADLDARDGIITNHNAGVFNGLEVYNVTVRNIYLRGMYASSGGTFSFHNNTVTNVRANPASIAMFAYGGGPGIMSNNTVSYANDAISANHSKGIQFLHNTISNSGSGVHTDNAGDGGGVADLIQGNTVTNCDATNGGYGIFVFVPYIAPTVKNNTVTNCLVGLSAWGQGATVMTRFTGNTVTGPGTGVADSVGAYVTTDMIGYGYSDVAASFAGNVISNNETGVLLTADKPSWEPDPFVAKSIVATFHCNQIAGNGKGVDLGVNGTINDDFTYNWWGDGSGPTTASNPTGTGDSVADGVTYSPWLLTQACSAVPPYTTGTTITANTPNPSSLGQSVTINFNVANIVGTGPVPAGTVEVSDGATVICSAVALDGSGNGSCSYSFSSSGSHPLTAVFTPTSTDSFKTSTGTATHIVLSTVTLTSTAAQDGWVRESTSTSGLGGTVNSTDISFVLGDDSANRQYSSILFFRTGLVPHNATIASVTLKFKRLGGTISNPFSTLGNIVADIKTGTFGSPALERSDFQTRASKYAALTFTNTPSGGWYSQSLDPGNFHYINRAGPTQFRLRFATDSNNNNAADYWTFFSGNALTAANQPQLVIEYYIP